MSLAKVAKLSKLSKEAAEELRKKIARDKAIKKANKDKKPTQKGLRLSKNKDIRMPDRDIDTPVVVGKTGITKTGEKINVGSSEDITRNIGNKERAKLVTSLELKETKKTITKKEKKLLDRLNALSEKTEADRKFKSGVTRKGAQTLPDGVYFNKQTGEEIKNPKVKSKLTVGGKENSINNWVKDPTKNQIESANRNRIAREKTDFRRDVEARIDAPKNAPISTGSAVEDKRKIGLGSLTNRRAKNQLRGDISKKMNKGGLKMPSAEQKGLKKLPTPVRNKMGYMYGGGMMKKPRMSSMDYRKGGLLLIAIDMMKKKKKGKKE